MKRFQQSAQAFDRLISLYPKHRNREEALYYLGSSYENVNEYERAALGFDLT